MSVNVNSYREVTHVTVTDQSMRIQVLPAGGDAEFVDGTVIAYKHGATAVYRGEAFTTHDIDIAVKWLEKKHDFHLKGQYGPEAGITPLAALDWPDQELAV